MVRSVVQKCSIVIYFIMCVRRSTFVDSKIQKLTPNDTNLTPEPLDDESSQENLVKLLETHKARIDEPGFDLTDDEINKFKIWPQGVIPYYIDVHSYSDKVLRDRIRGFLNTVSSATSLNFLELPSPPEDEDTRWVFFINRRGLLGCGDHSIASFTTKGVQKVVLGYDCMTTGGELAEAVLAIAGVPPQHNSPDRDEYIRVVDENIMPDKKQLFTKLNDNEWLFHDLEYDFSSAGHYHSHRYSVNGKATIEMQEKYQYNSVGESKVFSANDILKIKMLYNFISKKKQNITDCHKLFEPGRNFDKYRPSEDIAVARKKPNKYTGLTNDVSEEKADKKLLGPQAADNEDSKPDKTDTEDVPKKEMQQIIQNLDGSSNEVDLNKKSVMQKQLSFKTDPLSYLSDYKSSGDEKPSKMQKKYLSFGPPGKGRVQKK